MKDISEKYKVLIAAAKKKLNPYMLSAALCLGGFMGWYLAVLKIGQLKLSEFYAPELSADMKTAFLISEAVTLAVIIVFLLLNDVKRLISNKYFRLLPGVFLAEGSIALSLTSTNTVIPFSVIAGAVSAVGIMAVMTSILRVKLRHRLASIGMGLCIAAVIYLLSCTVIPGIITDTSAATIIGGLLVSVITILSVRFHDFGELNTKVIGRINSSSTSRFLKKFPFEFIFLIIICTAFFFSFNSSYALAEIQKPPDYMDFEAIAMISFAITSLVIVFFVRPHSISALFAAGAAVSGAAAILLNVTAVSGVETTLFSIFSHVGLACFRACTLLFVTTFSLNRKHTLFFAVLGYASVVASELWAQYFTVRFPPERALTFVYTISFFVLLPVGYYLISRGLARYGYTPQILEEQHKSRKILKELAQTADLTRRERDVLEQLCVEHYSVEELPERLFISEQAIAGHLKRICKKTGDNSEEELLARFNSEEVQHIIEN